MPHTIEDEKAVILFGKDGTKYVIPEKELIPFEAGEVAEIPDIVESDGVIPLVAVQVDRAEAAFYFFANL